MYIRESFCGSGGCQASQRNPEGPARQIDVSRQNCLPTVSRQFLTRNYPRPNCLLKCLPNCLSPTREGFLSSFKINPAVRVIARQVRGKNCLSAIFVLRHQSVSSGFPEKGADLRGSPGNVRGSPGNFRGSLGLWETSGEPLECCQVLQWENFQEYGEVAENQERKKHISINQRRANREVQTERVAEKGLSECAHESARESTHDRTHEGWFACFWPFNSPTKAPTNCPTNTSTEVPTKVSSQLVEVHLSCFHLFCSSDIIRGSRRKSRAKKHINRKKKTPQIHPFRIRP